MSVLMRFAGALEKRAIVSDMTIKEGDRTFHLWSLNDGSTGIVVRRDMRFQHAWIVRSSLGIVRHRLLGICKPSRPAEAVA